MAKNKKQEKNLNPVDKNSLEESSEDKEPSSEENLSVNEVESKITLETIKALEEKVLRAHAELKEISQALSSNNIEEIDPLGDKFDPNFHEALSIKEDKSKQAEEIIEVLQKGYKIQERVIRPALVIVNKI